MAQEQELDPMGEQIIRDYPAADYARAERAVMMDGMRRKLEIAAILGSGDEATAAAVIANCDTFRQADCSTADMLELYEPLFTDKSLVDRIKQDMRERAERAQADDERRAAVDKIAADLLPCPFCGGHAKLSDAEGTALDRLVVICEDCGAQTKSIYTGYTPYLMPSDCEKVAQKWNRRAK